MFLLTFLALCTLAACLPKSNVLYETSKAEVYFEDFIQKYNRQYRDDNEKQFRFEHFKRTLDVINAKNSQPTGSVHGITQFSDYTLEELSSLHCLTTSTPLDVGQKWITDKDVTTNNAPESFDWRDKNKITKIKDQKTCGSCWAFSAIGSLEGLYSIKYNELVEFSEQQLVACDNRDDGCFGGRMSQAYMSLIEMGGVETESDYPYTGSFNDKCKLDNTKFKAKLTNFTSYDLKDEDSLKETLYNVGPIAIAVDASDFVTYTGGVMLHCSFGKLNHGVVLVGYGTENGTPYWLIKNSWGEDWGEEGYVRIQRGNNSCGVLNNNMVTPVVA